MSADWMARAACRGLDTEIFFPERGGPVDEALAICARCPVRPECRDYALSDPALVGVWGGMSGRARLMESGVRRERQTRDEENDAAIEGLVLMLEKLATA